MQKFCNSKRGSGYEKRKRKKRKESYDSPRSKLD
jgi:hypothetical protein